MSDTSSMTPVLLLKVGAKKPQAAALVGDYESWFQRSLPKETLAILDLRHAHLWSSDWHQEFQALKPESVIIMGSPHSVYEPLDWYKPGCELVSHFVEQGTPIFGVCFGHQLLCDLLGGQVEAHSGGYEAGTVTIDCTEAAADDPLFSGMNQRFTANASHGDTVTKLPTGAKILAHNKHDPHQALRLSERIWTTQFHPEIALPEIRRTVVDRRNKLEASGQNVDELLARCQDTPEAQSLLGRFVEWARQQR